MSIPGLSFSALPGLALADPTSEHFASAAPKVRTQTLHKETEYRFESSFVRPITIKLLTGTAELFGTELAPRVAYVFRGTKGAVYTWHGCELEITGAVDTDYVAEETPMSQYANTHFALEDLRSAADDYRDIGPRVMIVGPENAGKTSLAKILTSYAVKSRRQPVLVNLDPRQGLLSVPGSLTATTFSTLVDVEEGWGSSPISGPSAMPVKMPLCYHFGCQDPEENAKLFKPLVTRLALATTSRLEEDPEARSSGCIIDTPGTLSSGKSSGYELIQHIASEFSSEFDNQIHSFTS
jgi:polyribonucleotide 5'-hydroxyl-kinase